MDTARAQAQGAADDACRRGDGHPAGQPGGAVGQAVEVGIAGIGVERHGVALDIGLVGDVVVDSHAIARATHGDRDRLAAPRVASVIADVIAWQPVGLAKKNSPAPSRRR